MKKRPLKVINAKYPLYIASAVLFLLTSGCNGTYSHEVEPIAKELYQKAGVETATVQRGDINPQLVFRRENASSTGVGKGDWLQF